MKPKVRALGLIMLVLLLAGGAAVLVHEKKRAQGVDHCAGVLIRAAETKDRAALEETLKNPSMREALLGADSVELLFQRPASSEWFRVGLGLHSKTSTRSGLMVIVLDTSALPACRFLGDYERGKGAFVPSSE
jgi:hypothetical protein